jgi:lipoate-protein ligase A
MSAPFPDLIWYHCGPASPEWNMAADEILLRDATSKPILRTYSWDRAAISFGYFERLADVSNPDGLPMVRRWTGGGAVRHGEDLTFALAVPRCFKFSTIPIDQSYEVIHRCLANALNECGVLATLSGDALNTRGPCFENPVASDVMLGRQKLAGGAQRRSRCGLIHQGSVQGIETPGELAGMLGESLSGHLVESQPFPESSLDKIADLASRKYGSRDWFARI